MNKVSPWYLLLFLCIAPVSGYIGCATMLMTDVAYNDRGETVLRHALTDEIYALGKPDPALVKELGSSDSAAVIGKKNTYLLSTGGKELLLLARLKLDPARVEIDTSAKRLFLDNNRVWGEITVRYKVGNRLSSLERAELSNGGFMPEDSGKTTYYTIIPVVGAVYPAVSLAHAGMPGLRQQRTIDLYARKHEGPSTIGKILKTPLVVVGVALDVALLPVYVIALATVAAN